MDQDFHYYGAYYAAIISGGYNREEATLIAKASNFIDFLSNEAYGGYWHIVRDSEKLPDRNYQVVAKIDYPRYTFQGGLSTGLEGGAGGLWAAFHFAPGNKILQGPDKTDILNRFGLILLGGRAHTIADTWAHQDWSPVDNEINTYWDVNGDWLGRQSIDYQDIGNGWKNKVLSSLNHANLQAVPNGTTYFGHGWMGHSPDYSFVKYRYKPCWRDRNDSPLLRDNPLEYQYAFLELCSLFAQSRGEPFIPRNDDGRLHAVRKAISSPCEIANPSNCPRVHSAEAWMTEMTKVDLQAPVDIIDVHQEPDPKVVLDGKIDYRSLLESRYGTYYIRFNSDLYLFAIASDYQFHFIKNWLTRRRMASELFTDSWSEHNGPLQGEIDQLF